MQEESRATPKTDPLPSQRPVHPFAPQGDEGTAAHSNPADPMRASSETPGEGRTTGRHKIRKRVRHKHRRSGSSDFIWKVVVGLVVALFIGALVLFFYRYIAAYFVGDNQPNT